MLRRIIICLAILMILPANLIAGELYRSVNDSIKVNNRFMDLKTFAYHITEKQRWSLIISNDVSVPEKEVKGNTIKEILDNFCLNSEFGWRFVKDCLYIANERELSTFFKQLPVLEMGLPSGNNEATYSGYFKNIDLSMLCLFLSSVSGTQISVTSGFDANIMMRVDGMPWKQVLLAVVYLNRYKLIISDFSIIISPEQN